MGTGELKGITRFHKVTIAGGGVFCALVAVRFLSVWWQTGRALYLLYAGIALAGLLALAIYLVRFTRRGIP